tara:strand:+ start:3046 stop:3516 length:471 start_codon:yes stop_codon:yes gene_type:complete
MATKPFFVPSKEVSFIDSVNEELIDAVVGQSVDIYKVSLDETNSNIYGEAADGIKTFEKGFRVNCLIQFNAPETLQDEFGPDTNSSIELFFHRNSLSGSNFYPEIGDIVDWNDFYWEMNSVTEPQLISGHYDYKHQVVATAHRTRLSNVNFEQRVM